MDRQYADSVELFSTSVLPLLEKKENSYSCVVLLQERKDMYGYEELYCEDVTEKSPNTHKYIVALMKCQ